MPFSFLAARTRPRSRRLATALAAGVAAGAACTTAPQTSVTGTGGAGGEGGHASSLASPSAGPGGPATGSGNGGGSGAGTGGLGGFGGGLAGPTTGPATTAGPTTGAGGSAGSGGAAGSGGVPLGGTPVVTQHNDLARSGANLGEVKLTTANVSLATFGKLFSRQVDDEVYAQALYLPNVTVAGQGVHNVLFVATMNDSLYAFDADDPSASAPLWLTSFLDPANGIVPLDHTDVGQACGTYEDIDGHIGILSTPVIDPATATLYVLTRTKDGNGGAHQQLHAIDTGTGKEVLGGPVEIQATFPGTGAGSVTGTLTFDPLIQNPRPALTLANGIVYVQWASHCDTGAYHGWMMGYDALSLAQTAVYVTTPNGAQGGLWMSGQGASVDATGNLYVVTGNGDFDLNGDYGTSVLKLSPALGPMDWFTPHDFQDLNAGDLDLGSAGALLVPGTDLLVAGGKGSTVYVMHQGQLGHWNQADDSQIVQTIPLGAGQIHGAPVAWQAPAGTTIYVWAAGDLLRSYVLQNGVFTPGPTGPMAPSGGNPGGVFALSANGSTPGSGVLWATIAQTGDANQQTVPGVLYALDASDLSELWTSLQAPGDDFGNLAKFCPPTVTAGKVFVPTFSKQVFVYGLK